MSNLIESCIKAIGFIKYNGCLIERDGDGWKWGGKKHRTLYLAKKAVDRAFKQLGKSIK